MPLYDFKCKGCDLTFERIVSSAERDKKTTTCRMCGGVANKLLSAPNFRIEGYSEANGYSDKGKGK